MNHVKTRNLTAMTGSLALAIASPLALGDQHQEQSAVFKEWQSISEKTVSADRVLAGDVHDQFNQLGNVRDLVLTPDRTRVEYILYETSYPQSFFGASDGFVSFENVAFDPRGAHGVNVRIDDPASMQDPQRLELTRREANNRLMSKLEEDEVVFTGDDGARREIENLLIDRDSGEITHYVVALNDIALFNFDPRAIPAADIDIQDDGSLSTDLSLSAVRNMAQISPALLK